MNTSRAEKHSALLVDSGLSRVMDARCSWGDLHRHIGPIFAESKQICLIERCLYGKASVSSGGPLRSVVCWPDQAGTDLQGTYCE